MTHETRETIAILVALAPWLAFLIAVVALALYGWIFDDREATDSEEPRRRLGHGL
jgi:hypothetical protein